MQMNHFQTSVISEYGSERNGLTYSLLNVKQIKIYKLNHHYCYDQFPH